MKHGLIRDGSRNKMRAAKSVLGRAHRNFPWSDSAGNPFKDILQERLSDQRRPLAIVSVCNSPLMNFYKRHLGDYAKDTRHLTITEHGAYTLMLDLYYGTEEPLPYEVNEICRKIGARTLDEKQAVALILREFFQKEARRNQHGGKLVATHRRVEREILEYKEWVKIARINGLKGGRPKTIKNHTPNQTLTQNNHSHTHTQDASTQNQKPQIQARKPYKVSSVFHGSNGGALTRDGAPPDLTEPKGWESRSEYNRRKRGSRLVS